MEDWKRRLYKSYVSTGQAGYKDEKKNFYNPYYDKIIKNFLPKNKNLFILDLACGYGRLVYSLKAHGYTNVIGVDISEEQVAIAHKLGITEVISQDLNIFLENSEPNKYDVVFLMDIMEHLEKPELFDLLDRIYAIMTNHGILIIHVPNGVGIFGMKVRYGDFTHTNAFTQQSIKQILQACNFSEIKCFEDDPVINSPYNLIRNLLWHVLVFPFRLLLIIESGFKKYILSQNMLVIAKKYSK